MKQKNTDPNVDTAAQAERRKTAVWSAVFFTLFRLLTAWALLWLRAGMEPDRLLAKIALLLLVLDLGSIIPVWINLRTRLKEIQGGEEDAAAQY